ncbi:MAG: hypothetical protein V9G19_01250 [Tetrasphaera sp.]
MTITPLTSVPKPPPPARSGQPWTPDDYDTLVRLAREGSSLDHICEVLQRGANSILDRARRMLPVDERMLPRDHAITRLQRHLERDPDYDWSTQLCTEPPRPAYPPPPIRSGVAGLDDDELIAFACLTATMPRVVSRPVRASVARALHDRGLHGRLEQLWLDTVRAGVDRMFEDAAPYYSSYASPVDWGEPPDSW